MTRKDILEQAGYEVLAEIEDRLFAVFGQSRDVIIRFYENGEGEKMVEGYAFESFRDDELETLQQTPHLFLEDFDHNTANSIPDWSKSEAEWRMDMTAFYV